MLLKILIFFVLLAQLYIAISGYEDIIKRMEFFTKTVEEMMAKTEEKRSFGRGQEEPANVMEAEFDFIIVGSGSAGSVLARRLSEITQWRILLLEAGNPGNMLTDVPVFAPLFQLTGFNWNYTMERQENFCLAMEDQVCAWPRGKALGGSSVINYMIYTRGNPKDYDIWAAKGNPGWSFEDIFPYYLKSEDCNLSEEICREPDHQKGGPISIEYPFSSKLTEAWIEAGGNPLQDYNSRDQHMGFSRIQATLKRGRRHNVAEAFLKPLPNNLKIIISARVTKILIDPLSKEAKGVVFKKRGRIYMAKARKEIILSAGTFNSAQLLMLSGVGPKDHLNDLGISLEADLPVGKTMYDHITFMGLAFKLNQTLEAKDSIFRPDEVINWLFKGKGVYTSLGGLEALGFINTKNPNSDYPDVELILSGPGSLEADFGIVVAKELRIKRHVYNKIYRPLELIPVFGVLPVLLHPKSKGYVKLRSKDPYDPPLLHGNYFSEPEDLETMVASIRYCIEMAKSEPLQKYGATVNDIPVPGCEQNVFGSDEYWRCALKSLSVTIHHQIGTCKMGPSSDPEAVVDSRLRVHGIKNLRVADCSVIPVTLSAHTNAPSIMIGEKAGDIIKEDWNSV